MQTRRTTTEAVAGTGAASEMGWGNRGSDGSGIEMGAEGGPHWGSEMGKGPEGGLTDSCPGGAAEAEELENIPGVTSRCVNSDRLQAVDHTLPYTPEALHVGEQAALVDQGHLLAQEEDGYAEQKYAVGSGALGAELGDRVKAGNRATDRQAAGVSSGICGIHMLAPQFHCDVQRDSAQDDPQGENDSAH